MREGDLSSGAGAGARLGRGGVLFREVVRALTEAGTDAGTDTGTRAGKSGIGTVIACGSRYWTDPEPVRWALAQVTEFDRDARVLSGGARGLDRMADGIARGLGMGTRVELADWVGRGRGAGPERNGRMLDLLLRDRGGRGPGLVLAWKDEFDRWMRAGGTENMCRIALGAGVVVLLYSHARGWERVLAPVVKLL